jgi:hypothetical protein
VPDWTGIRIGPPGEFGAISGRSQLALAKKPFLPKSQCGPPAPENQPEAQPAIQAVPNTVNYGAKFGSDHDFATQ